MEGARTLDRRRQAGDLWAGRVGHRDWRGRIEVWFLGLECRLVILLHEGLHPLRPVKRRPIQLAHLI